jgi:hypothetical protein
MQAYITSVFPMIAWRESLVSYVYMMMRQAFVPRLAKAPTLHKTARALEGGVLDQLRHDALISALPAM